MCEKYPWFGYEGIRVDTAASVVVFNSGFDFCPECGRAFNKTPAKCLSSCIDGDCREVFCSECKYFVEDMGDHLPLKDECSHRSNAFVGKNYLKTWIYHLEPKDLNKHNACEWFEAKS